MSHTPETPEKYVCLDCQVVHAATVIHEDGEHRFEAPDECGVCGHANFVTEEHYVRHHE